jgi:hypothetical protein
MGIVLDLPACVGGALIANIEYVSQENQLFTTFAVPQQVLRFRLNISRMSQRIQSIFLLLAALINLSTLFVPMWQISSGTDTELITGLQISNQTISGSGESSEFFFAHEEPLKTAAHTLFFALTLITSVFLILVIYADSDRSGKSRLKRQMNFAYLGIGLLAVQILSLIWMTQQNPSLIMSGSDRGMAHFGFAFPLVAIILIWLAIKRIKQTDRLIHSDRLR